MVGLGLGVHATLRTMAHNFEIIATGIYDKGSVVVLMIMGPESWRPIALCASAGGCGMEGIDDVPIYIESAAEMKNGTPVKYPSLKRQYV
jgi:hypothetical protein